MTQRPDCFVVVGAGQAGAQAVDTLRREGFTGRLVLIGEEHELPYQRPPLSKKFLAGELAADRLTIRHSAFYDENHIETRIGTRVSALNTTERRLNLNSGETLCYDSLLLCLGASSRLLDCPGHDLGGVHYLRGLSDTPEIQTSLKVGARIVIVGGGYIGLETAATARKLGCNVTVLEASDRLMNRVVAPSVSEFFEIAHRSHDVKIVCNVRITHLTGDDRVRKVVCANGLSYECDTLIAGVGAIPNVMLAAQAGLQCNNGIVVDEYCRTSEAGVFAAGDCANHPSPRYGMRVRVESVDNAVEQAKVAALNMLDRSIVYDRVPWFWSDQFDNKLLIAGLSAGYDQKVTRGDPRSRSFSVCYLKAGEILAVEAVNNVKDYMAARTLINERARPAVERLADQSIALKEV